MTFQNSEGPYIWNFHDLSPQEGTLQGTVNPEWVGRLLGLK